MKYPPPPLYLLSCLMSQAGPDGGLGSDDNGSSPRTPDGTFHTTVIYNYYVYKMYTLLFYRCTVHYTCTNQEARYVERWPNTTSTWAGWSRFDIPVDRYGGVHSLLICTSIPLGFPTCHRASQQENTYWTKYQKADRASTLVTMCVPTRMAPFHSARRMYSIFTTCQQASIQVLNVSNFQLADMLRSKYDWWCFHTVSSSIEHTDYNYSNVGLVTGNSIVSILSLQLIFWLFRGGWNFFRKSFSLEFSTFLLLHSC